MEVSTEVSTAPIVTKSESSFAESSQETKVEKITNGTVETAASSEKSVTQSAQSTISNNIVEEIKQESSSSSFSSSSVTVEENPSFDANANEASSEGVAEVSEKSEATEKTDEIQENEAQVEQEPISEVQNMEISEPEVAAVQIAESKVEQAESEIAPNSHIDPNSSVVNSDEPIENAVQTNECDQKSEQENDTEGADQGGLPTIPKVEPILDALSSIETAKPEVKAEVTSAQVPAVESLPPAVLTAPVEMEAKMPEKQQQQQQQSEISHQLQYTKEIEQESIKKQLNEIITDIEKNVQITNDDATENSNEERGVEGKKPIDLQKIFTPANDADEIKPGTNRKLFASSSFYSPAIHPTVEDQVELARRISHSLSDISNQQSKGQSMYVNRKKRSVKWIHDDDGQEEQYFEEHQSMKENGYETSSQQIEHSTSQQPSGTAATSSVEPKKVPLKLVMDPRHVQDFNSMRQFGYEPAPMSPEFGLELCNALNAPNGKGAELFAKRRKKAEKWVVDGSKQQQQQQATTPTASAQFLPAFSDVGIQRVQHNMKLDQIQEKYINQQPTVKMVRSPWEAALETGNVDNAFVTYDQQSSQQQQQMYQSSTIDYGSNPSSSLLQSSNKKDSQYQSSKQFTGRDLAYKPSVPQGWNREIKLQTEIEESALENEMQEIYEAQKSYMELIREFTPTPPVVEYEIKCGEVETNVYEEPIKELIVDGESREATPEYQTVPVKALINTFEQGIFTAPEIPVAISTTSSITSSEKFSKFSSTTSTSFQDVFSSETSNFKQEQSTSAPINQQAPFKPQQQPATAPFKSQQQYAPVQQQTAKPYQPANQSYPPNKPQTPVSFNKPQTPVNFNKPQTPVSLSKPQTPVNVAAAPMPIAKPQAPPPVVSTSPAPIKPLTPVSMSPRSGLNASPVTPGILKKQIQLDAAVPIPPGGVVGSTPSPVPNFGSVRLGAKSPVPFVNTAPAPFNPQFPPLSVQTPETIAQVAPLDTPLVPPLKNPAEIPMPLIVSTPLPKYSNCYNNAARPFNEFKDYYKPIHMEEGKKLIPPLIYTDF